ncbi:RING finger protein [Scatolibacter rhodanostii]|uniref:RING finger protein n=1 Tax=Scatolibacter rhodanostii TaxID=2014781 RepID=UPI000C0681AF|nr:RING finger protein [Scatolibacter rhodanostii]
MLDYTGIKCPCCDIAFRKEDDIVVCPHCGAPYHRHCYDKAGNCIFADEHDSGKEWKAPEAPQAPNPDTEIKDKECAVCGTLNSTSALFCNRCGSPLIGQPELHQNRQEKNTREESAAESPEASSPNGYPFVGMPGVLPFDLMGGVNPTETIEDDITFGDISKLVKQNTPYYMPRFRYIKLTNRNKFNLSAFLFGGSWMLYRKMYKRGTLFSILQFGLYLAYIFVSMFISAPALAQALEHVGVDYSGGLSLTSVQWLAVSDYLMQNPDIYFRISLQLIILAVLFITLLYCGFTANKAYMKHCISTIRQIKSEDAGRGDTSLLLEEKGGVNLGIAICMLFCYMIITNLPTFI